MRIKKNELKELLREAFTAGAQSEADAYWYSHWEDFDEWYERVIG